MEDKKNPKKSDVIITWSQSNPIPRESDSNELSPELSSMTSGDSDTYWEASGMFVSNPIDIGINETQELDFKKRRTALKTTPISNYKISVEDEFDSKVPNKYKEIFENRDSGYYILKMLKDDYKPHQIISGKEDQNMRDQRIWELIGLRYSKVNRWFEALQIFYALYQHMLKWQIENNDWTHKAMPLVWMADIYHRINFKATSKAFMMMVLVDDSIRDLTDKGSLNIKDGGTYFRLRYKYGMSHEEITGYSKKIYDLYIKNNGIDFYRFPEYILQKIDHNWKSELPTLDEYSYYSCNPVYIEFLEKKKKDGSGKALENLAAYLISCIPGSRVFERGRQRDGGSDYDALCSIDGQLSDFRSDLSRYFICECKDLTKDAVDFTTIAKLSRVLTSIKSNFGIIFTNKGVSGKGKMKSGEKEIFKIYQDSGMVILVIDESDIRTLKEGGNLIGMIRTKYERIRLDLQ